VPSIAPNEHQARSANEPSALPTASEATEILLEEEFVALRVEVETIQAEIRSFRDMVQTEFDSRQQYSSELSQIVDTHMIEVKTLRIDINQLLESQGLHQDDTDDRFGKVASRLGALESDPQGPRHQQVQPDRDAVAICEPSARKTTRSATVRHKGTEESRIGTRDIPLREGRPRRNAVRKNMG